MGRTKSAVVVGASSDASNKRGIGAAPTQVAVGATCESGDGTGFNPEDNNDATKPGAVYVWR